MTFARLKEESKDWTRSSVVVLSLRIDLHGLFSTFYVGKAKVRHYDMHNITVVI